MRIVVTDLIPGKDYNLQFRSKNEAGEVSVWGNTHRVTISTQLSKPLAPENVQFESIGDSFHARWDQVTHSDDGSPATDLTGYVVLFRNVDNDQTAQFETTDTNFELTYNLNFAMFTPTAGRIGVKVAAKNILGSMSEWSDEVITQNPPPGPVRNLTAVGGIDSIISQWEPPENLEDDFKEYRVHIGTSPEFTIAEGNLIWRGVGTTALYQTSSVVQHYVKVVAVDKFNGVSQERVAGPVTPRSAADVDVDAPDTPTDLDGSISGNRLTVTWTAPANPDQDLAGYQIGYRPVGQTGWSYATASHEDTSVVIEPITRFVNYEIKIQAHDFSFNYSNWSANVTVDGETNVAPAVPVGLVMKAGITSVMLVWDRNTEDDLKEYEVQFETASPVESDTKYVTPGTTMSFSKDIVEDTTYYARVRSVDFGGLKSNWSPVVSGTPGLNIPLWAVDNGELDNRLMAAESDLAQVEDNIVAAQEILDQAFPAGAFDVEGRFTQTIKNSVVEYAVNSSEVNAPTTGWSDSQPTRTPGSFIWFRTVVTYGDDTTATSSPALMTGNAGPQGSQGVPGSPGEDGTSLYTWLKYADTPTTGMSDSPAGKTYMGVAYNKTIATESSNYADYQWSLIKGADGGDGKGISSTVVNYAKNTSGTAEPTTGWATTVPATSPGEYLWTRTVTTYTDNSNSTAYSVAKHGSTGSTGATGRGITGTTVTYQKSASGTVEPTTWLTTIPATAPGEYLWTRTVTSYSSAPTSVTSYSVAKHGETGSQGIQGPPGEDGQPTYTWIKYADTATGTGMSDSPVGKAYIGIAYNKLTQAESSVAGDYTWALIQGPKGDPGADAATISVTASTQALISPATGGATSPATAVITATPKNTVVSLWEYSVDGGAFTTTKPSYVSTPSSNSVTVTGSGMSRTISVRASGGGVSDSITIAKVMDGAKGEPGGPGTPGAPGADAYTVFLTNEAQVLPGAVANAIAGSTTFDAVVYKGATQINATIGTITGHKTGLTTSVNNTPMAPRVTVTVTTALTAGGELTVPITADGKTFEKKFTWSVSFAGAAGAQGISVSSVTPFYRAVATGAAAPAQPSGTADPAGWSKTEPSFAANTELYRTERILYSNNTAAWTPVTKVASYAGIDAAMQAANSKNTVTYSDIARGATIPTTPSTSGRVAGDTHRVRYTDNGEIAREYRLAGSPLTWQEIKYGDGTFTSIDVGKITGGSAAFDQFVANNIVGRVATIIELDTSRLRASTATIDDAVINKLWTDVVRSRKITTDMMIVGSGENLIPNGSGWAGSPGGWARSDVGWDTTDKPDHLPGAFVFTGTSTVQGTYDSYFDVTPGAEYHFEVWLKADKPNSRMFIEARDQDGNHAIDWTAHLPGENQAVGNPYLVSNHVMPTTWTRYAGVVRMKQTTQQVRIGGIYVNHSSGTERTATQKVAGMRLRSRTDASLVVDGGIKARNIDISDLTSDNAFISNLVVTTANITDLTFDKISGGSGIINNVVVKSTLTLGDASNNGIIQTHGYNSTKGVRIDKNGIIVNSGSISASALNIQYGQNLVPLEYADFEFDPQFYSNSTWTPVPSVTPTIVTSSKYNKQSIRLTSTSATTYQYMFLAPTTTAYNIQVEAGKTYILSGWIKRTAGTNLTPNIRAKYSNGSYSSPPTPTAAAADNTWYRVSHTFTVPAGVTAMNVVLYASYNVAATIGNVVDFDGIQLEEKIAGSDEPSAWTPPSATSIDGAMIRTGEIRSNTNITVNGSSQPMWSINTNGGMQIGSAVIRGGLTVGATSDGAGSFIQSSNYVQGTSGFLLRGSDGYAEFRNLASQSIKADAIDAGNIAVALNITAGGKIIAGNVLGARTELDDTGLVVYGTRYTKILDATGGSIDMRGTLTAGTSTTGIIIKPDSSVVGGASIEFPHISTSTNAKIYVHTKTGTSLRRLTVAGPSTSSASVPDLSLYEDGDMSLGGPGALDISAYKGMYVDTSNRVEFDISGARNTSTGNFRIVTIGDIHLGQINTSSAHVKVYGDFDIYNESAWTAYTPSFTSTGTNPTIGNSTRSGRYRKIGRTVHFTITILLGSTFRPGTGVYIFGLPVPAAPQAGTQLITAHTAGDGEMMGVGKIEGQSDPSVILRTMLVQQTRSNDSHVAMGANFPSATGMSAGTRINFSGTYEAAS